MITVNQIAPGSVGHGDNEFLIPDLWRTMFSHLTTRLQNFSAGLGSSLSPMTMASLECDVIMDVLGQSSIFFDAIFTAQE